MILTIYSDYCGTTTNPSDRKDCDKLDKVTGFPYCCFIKSKDKSGNEGTACIPVSQNDYDNIKDYKKSLENLGGTVKKIDCKSFYIEFSLLSLILLLL